MNDERGHSVMKVIGIIVATFLGAFLAFYFVADMTMKKMFDPMYQMRRAEKMFDRDFKRMEKNMFMSMPNLVNITKNNHEYKIFVNLKPLNNDENNVRVVFDNNTVTVSGAVDKDKNNKETILNFSQTFILDEDIDVQKVTKEKYHHKYIITIPYNEDENENNNN